MAELLDRNQNDDFRDRDVTDAWIYLTPGKTPFLAMAPKGRKPKVNTLEQPVLLRPTPQDVPIPDGLDVEDSEYENIEDLKKLVKGRYQTARRATKVGAIANVLGAQVPKLPPQGSLLRQNIEAFMIALRRDVELVCLSVHDSFEEVDDDNPNQTRGAGSWIRATAQTDVPVPAEFLTPAGNILSGKATEGAITEDDLRGILVSIYESTEEPADLDMFARLGLKSGMADWTKTGTQSSTTVPLRRFNQDATEGKIKLSVSIYEGEGLVRVHPHFHLPAGAGASYIWSYLFNMDFWNVHMVDRPKFTPHPDKGGGPRGHMSHTFFNMCTNPTKHGKMTK